MPASTSCLQVWVCPCRDRNCSLGKSVCGNLQTPFISTKTRQTSLDLLSHCLHHRWDWVVLLIVWVQYDLWVSIYGSDNTSLVAVVREGGRGGSYGGLSIKTTCCCGETPDHMVRRFPSCGVFDWVCVFRDWQYLEPVQCMNINIWTFPHAAEFGMSGSEIFWNIIRCCVTLLCLLWVDSPLWLMKL